MRKPPDRSRVSELVFAAVHELNRQLPRARRLEPADTTPLSGAAATLDSLGLLNLVVLTEQKLEQEFGVAVTLADDDTLGRDQSPFRTLGTLADHARCVLEHELDG